MSTAVTVCPSMFEQSSSATRSIAVIRNRPSQRVSRKMPIVPRLNRFNRGTIGIFLLTRWLGLFLMTAIDLVALELCSNMLGHTVTAVLIALSAVVAAIYYASVEGLFEALSPPPPRICSVYDPRFWWVERIWKLHPIHFLHLFDGTPFKSVLWRLIGVRI